MYDRRRIQICKWTAVVLGIVFLSQAIARWRAFFAGPTVLTYVAIITAGSVFLLLLTALAIVVYAEEKAKGTLNLPRPWLEALADRFFMIHTDLNEGDRPLPLVAPRPPRAPHVVIGPSPITTSDSTHSTKTTRG